MARGIGTLSLSMMAGLAAIPSAAADPVAITDQGKADQAPVGTVVVTATRVAQPSFDLPVSIDALGPDTIQDERMKLNLSESLVRVPGILVQNRQNYAQDVQISSRGFGARTTFGVVGVRVYVDGIPATTPDGQGQITHIDLGSAGRIEVLRGPFSALYGNSSGGVISIFTENGKPGTALDTSVEAGSYGTQRYAEKVSGAEDGYNYVVDGAFFHTAGYRAHSAAERADANAKLGYTFEDQSELTLIANTVHLRAQDPMGLTRAQYIADPSQAGTGAIAFNTRKFVDQGQAGLTFAHPFGDDDTVVTTAYIGHRNTTQFQSIPKATEASPYSPGGVIDLGRGYVGTDLHVTDRRTLDEIPVQATVGISSDVLDEARTGYQNFVGSTLGVEGLLRRDLSNQVYDIDQYLEVQAEPIKDWVLTLGVRHSDVEVNADDHLVPGGGGNAGYEATNPVAGLTFRMASWLNLYGSYGRGFETPTLDELAYRSTTGTLPGLNFALRPSHSNNYETGVKLRLDDKTQLTVAAFHVDTVDEIGVEANANGRSVYQNVGKTRRNGIEAGFNSQWKYGFGVTLAYTYLHAIYAQPFETCPGVPCVRTLIPSGNRLPGVPLSSAYGEVSWRHEPTGFSTAIEVRGESKVFVNDTNSDAAPDYVTENLRAGFEQIFGSWRFKEFVRLDNLLDRRYAGSVIVNDSNKRYFEPSPSRSFFSGVNMVYSF